MRTIVLPPAVLLVSLSLTGCLSMAVMERATGPRYRFARMTEITDAVVAGTDLYVRVLALRPDRVEPEPVVLKIGSGEKNWSRSHSTPDASYMDGFMLAHVPATSLVESGAIPDGGAHVPIESIVIRRFDGLRSVGKVSKRRVRVLAVHYRPVENDLPLFWEKNRAVPPPGDPLLVVVRPDSDGPTDNILISDIQDGHTTRRAWLVALPFAAAADAVVLPLELAGAMAEAE